MVCVRFIHYCVWTLSVMYTLIFNVKCSIIINTRSKRTTDDNFSILLNLYKMNPLKESEVFKMFSNKILLPNRGDQTPALHFDANESAGENQMQTTRNLKQIEDVIHARSPRSKGLNQPLYVVENTAPEQFDVAEKKLVNFDFQTKEVVDEAFNDIFGHIDESKETIDKNQTTVSGLKMTPATELFASMENNEIPAKMYDEGIVIMR